MAVLITNGFMQRGLSGVGDVNRVQAWICLLSVIGALHWLLFGLFFFLIFFFFFLIRFDNAGPSKG